MEDEADTEAKVLTALSYAEQLLPILLGAGLTHNDITFTFLVAAQAERSGNPEMCAFMEARALPHTNRIIDSLMGRS